MSDDIGNKLKLLLRSEKALLKLEMRRRGRQTVLAAIGIIAVFAALAALNLSAYLYLSTMMSAPPAALALAGANILLALLFFFIASKQQNGPEAEAITEIRDFALAQLGEDVDEFKQNAAELKNGIRKVSNGVSGLFNREFMALGSLMPIVQLFMESRKKGKNP